MTVSKQFIPDTVFRGHESPISAIAFKDKQILSGSTDGSFILWDIETYREKVTKENAHDKSLTSCGFLLNTGHKAYR